MPARMPWAPGRGPPCPEHHPHAAGTWAGLRSTISHAHPAVVEARSRRGDRGRAMAAHGRRAGIGGGPTPHLGRWPPIGRDVSPANDATREMATHRPRCVAGDRRNSGDGHPSAEMCRQRTTQLGRWPPIGRDVSPSDNRWDVTRDAGHPPVDRTALAEHAPHLADRPAAGPRWMLGSRGALAPVVGACPVRSHTWPIDRPRGHNGCSVLPERWRRSAPVEEGMLGGGCAIRAGMPAGSHAPSRSDQIRSDQIRAARAAS
jgi:hypothetical protein